MKASNLILATILATVTLISGCANTDTRPASSRQSNSGVAYGVIDSIESTSGSNDTIGAGAIIGGVVGGVLGNQVGRGTGNDVATVAGVVGGAVVGHQVEMRNRQQDAYRIHVRLDRGGYQTVTQSITDLRVGDRVRIENNRVSRD
ncbi:MAG: glycine zipper 2TM domain-containing protein [Gallionella sp.]